MILHFRAPKIYIKLDKEFKIFVLHNHYEISSLFES